MLGRAQVTNLNSIVAATDLSAPARHAVERAAMIAAGKNARLSRRALRINNVFMRKGSTVGIVLPESTSGTYAEHHGYPRDQDQCQQ